MNGLAAAAGAGRVRDVSGLLATMTSEERKAALPVLKEIRAEIRGWDWDRWRERGAVQDALLVAGAGCLSGAAAAAAWIGARDLRSATVVPYGVVAAVLEDRDPTWLADVAHRLAARVSTAQQDAPLIQELVGMSGCETPTTDEYVQGWALSVTPARVGPVALREDRHAPVLVPRMFEATPLPSALTTYDDPDHPLHWPSTLARLAEEGVLDRAVLVDGCVLRLLRGGRPGEMRSLLHVLRGLGLTPAEESARVADWSGMAADGLSTVAAHAQQVLGRVAARGELSTRALAEMSAGVLFRTEKKLVRAQLSLLGKELRRDPAAAPELLPVVSEAFGHEDSEVRARALKLVARYVPAVDAGVREELAASAVLLGPAHRGEAETVFGALGDGDGEAVSEDYEEILPPAPSPRRLDPAPESVAEVVEQLLVLLRGAEDVVAFERVLDGVVRVAHREREALAEALRAAMTGRWWTDGTVGWADDRFSQDTRGLEVVAAALTGRVSARMLDRARSRPVRPGLCAHAGLSHAVDSRLWEVCYFLITRPLPFLLATPTWHTGTLDAEVLVDRLREYARLGARPAPVDFAQALLRVRREGGEAAAKAAAGLGTQEGDRLAAWLGDPEPVVPVLRTATADDDGGAQAPATSGLGRRIAEARERPAFKREFPRPLQWLGHTQDIPSHRCYHWEGGARYWPAVLPQDGEALAMWLLPGVRATAQDDARGDAWCLPVLAEAEGRPGPYLHRALACGLGARYGEDRLAAVDALLVLAARRQLDTGLVGREVAALVRDGTVKLNRLADSARTAAATGAYRTVWGLLAAALPALPAVAPAPRGLGEILEVAADCVERCGPDTASRTAGSGLVPGLTEQAGRGGSSRLVVQASRLLAALRQGSEHRRPETAKTSR
ncbi:hypothetical protein HW130_30535 [Streptomyces sp. PKU-EA00015]|uniref:DUF7824 domain-containing protein n=1 Tax=Streptomyces sp. PKU-EA00015 TaxID=2748326 RepID=UPI0015A3E877|nr:DUF6493 family protein [Streptomyces sp. PKU-EA00015]NWF30543.1 hypothetical protein [Streptomyces sp. PKU-EA00015]